MAYITAEELSASFKHEGHTFEVYFFAEFNRSECFAYVTELRAIDGSFLTESVLDAAQEIVEAEAERFRLEYYAEYEQSLD